MDILAWGSVVAYFLLTTGVAVYSARRSRSLKEHAVGSRDIPAIVIGLSLSAQLTSVATFVVNPGLVYAFGLPGLYGYGVSAGLGIFLGLAILSKRFRRQGERVQALTVPQWIEKRFNSRALGTVFAILSLGLLSFATLIVVGLTVVMAPLLGISPAVTLVALVTLAVGAVLVGGATGHAWTNAAQAAVMLVVALLMIGGGIPALLSHPDPTAALTAGNPYFLQPVNPASPYFRTFFEVFVCNFIVGLAIVCQPHVISKSLYLKDERDVRRYLITAILFGVVFTSVLVTGVWAKLTLIAPARIDGAIPAWIASQFSHPTQVLIAIGLLCAGLSTLEGIFLALSSIIAVDIFPRLVRSPSDRAKLLAGRFGLTLGGIITVGLALWQIEHPTGGTVAIFAQYGVYLLFSASFIPLACGMFVPRAATTTITVAVLTCVAVYLGVSFLQLTPYHNNPGFLATAGILSAWMVVGAGLLIERPRPQVQGAAV